MAKEVEKESREEDGNGDGLLRDNERLITKLKISRCVVGYKGARISNLT